MNASTGRLTMPFAYLDMDVSEREYGGGFDWKNACKITQIVTGCLAVQLLMCIILLPVISTAFAEQITGTQTRAMFGTFVALTTVAVGTGIGYLAQGGTI